MDFRIKGKKEDGLTAVLLLYRFGILLLAALLILRADGPFRSLKDILFLCYGGYQVVVACMFKPVMNIRAARLIFCCADLLIALTAVFLTGGISSPLIPCLFPPIFTLYVIYGRKGAGFGWLGCLAGAVGILLISEGWLPTGGSGGIAPSLAGIGISVVLFYLLPCFAVNRYFTDRRRRMDLEAENEARSDMNGKLMAICAMAGRLSCEAGPDRIMDRLLALCRELFSLERVCIFLIRNGEVEIYGKPAAEEKESIYQLIMEEKKGKLPEEDREYILREGSLAIPLIRGARTDGVLSLGDWKRREISDREIILFSMIANLICTYLENMDYVESLQLKHIPDTSIFLNHLDSGKTVRGILDKRILPT